MSLLDLAVISVLALVAAVPFGKKALTLVRKKAAPEDTIEAWRQKWVSSLVTLGRDIESNPSMVNNPQQSTLLTRELTWEIIGGDAKPPVK